ncbi:tetratricopeptide repeat protein 34 [Polypterus senegalus]|uniref:tetratricopeptide repeat protein 34 n=1 Tax=Polypterus senegalus TaxID=55291 RepID=UPI0019624570|nr:tetratricopeptide repeat protein 34 [Polypterus senegalus]
MDTERPSISDPAQKENPARQLCQEADKLWAQGFQAQATTCYTSAFGLNAGATAQYVRGLSKQDQEQIVVILENWLDWRQSDRQPCPDVRPGFNLGLAAVFLSTIRPNNLQASLFKMGTLLKSGRCTEVLEKCNRLLEETSTGLEELGTSVLPVLLTRALACLLLNSHSDDGVTDYLQAFRMQRGETVQFVTNNQTKHLPLIVQALQDHQRVHIGQQLESDCHNLLVALVPNAGGTNEDSLTDNLNLQTKWDDAQQHQSSSSRKSQRLVDSAAAHFSVGGRGRELFQDIASAFQLHPVAALRRVSEVFGPQTQAIMQSQLQQQVDLELASYREVVRSRQDLRSTEGVELLTPIISALRALAHMKPVGGNQEILVQLVDCLVLTGNYGEALSVCRELRQPQSPQSYANTILALRGFAWVQAGQLDRALEDFRAVVEHPAPHPSSCVRALCGRGLLRMLTGSSYLSALDYITASQLRLEEAVLVVKSYIPWNQRGLLCTVLQEEGRKMLQKAADNCDGKKRSRHEAAGSTSCLTAKEGDAAAVHCLACLLMELDPSCDLPRILATDALYKQGRSEEAYRLLLVAQEAHCPPVLARLALLQLRRGFLYDANQLLKKLIQLGNTSCLLPIVALCNLSDRQLLWHHCHAVATHILESHQGDTFVKESVAYLSLAIIASGGEAFNSLLARARCYAHLGQYKTAVFDFSAILRLEPNNVQALCGRGFTHLILNQQKEATMDIIAAVKVDAAHVTRDVLSLKEQARELICGWLCQYCRASLFEFIQPEGPSCRESGLNEVFLTAGMLISIDSGRSNWHLVYIDILLAQGKNTDAMAHHQKIFGVEPTELPARARLGLMEALQGNLTVAAEELSKIAEDDTSTLDFLLTLLPEKQKRSLAQVAAQKASSLSEMGQSSQALGLLSLATKAGGEKQTQYLRQRAFCLLRLGHNERAILDLDRVIQSHLFPATAQNLREMVQDYCGRGQGLLLMHKQDPGLVDFSQALDLDALCAVAFIECGLGRVCLVQHFLQGAMQQFERQHLKESWRLAGYGLLIDENNLELRKLRSKIKREASGSCTLN